MAPKTNKDGAKAAAKAKVEKAKQVPPLPLRYGLTVTVQSATVSFWVAVSSCSERFRRVVQAAADKTFGLKNKNKSKAVQQCVIAQRAAMLLSSSP